MRHRKKFNHLSRTASHRKAMLSNMAASLIMHKRIRTTVAKAKALRVYVEPLITRSKEDTTHQRRMVFRKLQNKVAVAELFREVSMKVADRPGGYTRIIKLGKRLGDNADMAMIELVDFNENLLTDDKKTSTKAKSTRRRGRKKSEGQAVPAAASSTDTTTAEKAEKPKAAVETPEPAAEMAETNADADQQAETAAEMAEPKAAAEAGKEAPAEQAETTEPETQAAPDAKTEEKPAAKTETIKEETAAEEDKKETPEAKAEETTEEEPKADDKDKESK